MTLMKDCTVKITDNRSRKVWSYQLDIDQAFKVAAYLRKMIEGRQHEEPRGTLAGLFDD